MTIITREEAMRRWTIGNNQGEGYAPIGWTHDVGETIEALVADEWSLVYRARNNCEIAVLTRGGEIIGIGNAHGAWAVKLK